MSPVIGWLWLHLPASRHGWCLGAACEPYLPQVHHRRVGERLANGQAKAKGTSLLDGVGFCDAKQVIESYKILPLFGGFFLPDAALALLGWIELCVVSQNQPLGQSQSKRNSEPSYFFFVSAVRVCLSQTAEVDLSKRTAMN